MRHKLLFVAVLASLSMLTACLEFKHKAPEAPSLSYAPWVDLNMHFNLESVQKLEGGNSFKFNSYEIAQSRVPWTSDRLDNSEYSAKILGTGVSMRTQPVVAYYTKCETLNTGHSLMVTQHNQYYNGRYWCYCYFRYPGTDVYQRGYVCSDYIVSAEQYDMVSTYLFKQGSNLNIQTPSKFLRAAADVLLKLEADKRRPNLSMQMLSNVNYGEHTIATYQVRDFGSAQNNTLLAVVQFFNNNNDFLVLGVVPGVAVNNVLRNANGSYDVYFY